MPTWLYYLWCSSDVYGLIQSSFFTRMRKFNDWKCHLVVPILMYLNLIVPSAQIVHMSSIYMATKMFGQELHNAVQNNICVSNVKAQSICGPLGPNFDGFCANNTTKTKIGVFSLWKVLLCGTFQRPNVPLFVFMPLLAQEPSNLGPNGPQIGWDFTNRLAVTFCSN